MMKIFVVHDKDVYIPENEVLVPICSNRTDGINIVGELDYCELRAHYWVWNNEPEETGMVGFFHYRRYLNLKNNYKKNRPYEIKKFPEPNDYIVEEINQWITAYDIIAPLKEYTGVSVIERYSKSEGHRGSDWEIIEAIIEKKYPDYLDSYEKYMNGKAEYYGNIFIMKKIIFDQYCIWLFDILREFDAKVLIKKQRANGYIAERLFGIYLTKANQDNILKIAEVPRIHFYGYDDKNHNFRIQKLFNYILPPGGKLRSKIIKQVYDWRKGKNE